jgi:hypothetical protein
MLKFSRAISGVNVQLKTNISEISFVSIIRANVVNYDPDDGDGEDLRNVGF